VKFLVDMPLSPSLAAWLRDQGHDAIHACDLGLSASSDADVLARAKQDGRIIVTADLDYPRLLALAQTTDPGLVLLRDGNWSDSDVVSRMREILRALTVADFEQSIIVIDRNRVRRRRLPISD
jgi:predicted nuclease of predicted toxin-antitoxin system